MLTAICRVFISVIVIHINIRRPLQNQIMVIWLKFFPLRLKTGYPKALFLLIFVSFE